MVQRSIVFCGRPSYHKLSILNSIGGAIMYWQSGVSPEMVSLHILEDFVTVI